VAVAALVVRLVWNLFIHRPMDWAVSDMGGYVERARTSIDHFGERLPYFTLFPWGTHFMLMLLKRAFGRDNAAAIGILYACLGAGAVAYSYLLAARMTRSAKIAKIAGWILVFYYPWIALGGYVLSEPPFTLLLCLSTYHGLLLADRGRARDAWLFGAGVAIGALFRPQILIALPLYAIHFAVRRRAWHVERGSIPRLLVAVALPLVLVLSVSAARMRFHTGKLGLISNNGPLNFAFGRCHAKTIHSTARDRKGAYSPPSLGALRRWEDTHPSPLFRLHPVMGEKLHFDGHMWDAEPLYWLAAECVRKGGVGRQVEFAASHVVLLWGYNTIWPDSVSPPRFRLPMEIASGLHAALILPGAIVGLFLSFRRRHARWMLAALHVWGLFAVAILYFGDTRLRAPYDGFLLLLALMVYAGFYRRFKAAKRA
jgi:hypothetical protein